MLCLGLYYDKEELRIGDTIVIKARKGRRSGQVELIIDAPREIPIVRSRAIYKEPKEKANGIESPEKTTPMP